MSDVVPEYPVEEGWCRYGVDCMCADCWFKHPMAAATRADLESALRRCQELVDMHARLLEEHRAVLGVPDGGLGGPSANAPGLGAWPVR